MVATRYKVYDLEKAFDLIEYPILLHRLCGIGINGKLWRLLKDWYCGLRGCVRLNGHKSGEFPVMRGIRQESVLSPILFLMVMDPLLQQLEKSALGPSINNLYLGASFMLTTFRRWLVVWTIGCTGLACSGVCKGKLLEIEHPKVWDGCYPAYSCVKGLSNWIRPSLFQFVSPVKKF